MIKLGDGLYTYADITEAIDANEEVSYETHAFVLHWLEVSTNTNSIVQARSYSQRKALLYRPGDEQDESMMAIRKVASGFNFLSHMAQQTLLMTPSDSFLPGAGAEIVAYPLEGATAIRVEAAKSYNGFGSLDTIVPVTRWLKTKSSLSNGRLKLSWSIKVGRMTPLSITQFRFKNGKVVQYKRL